MKKKAKRRFKPLKKRCKACEGTGKSSKGGECFPCKGEGYIRCK